MLAADTKLTIATLRHPKDLLVEARDLCVDYGGGPIFGPLRFEIRRGERVAAAGAQRLRQVEHPEAALRRGYPPHRHARDGERPDRLVHSAKHGGLCGSLRDFCTANGLDESLFKTILRKLEFQRAQFEKRMEDFSEGQKKKVLIAKSLCEKAHLLVWDEPLNFIDVISRMQLEDCSAAPRRRSSSSSTTGALWKTPPQKS